MSGPAVVDRAGVAREALLEFTRASDVGELISETTDDDGVTTVLFRAEMLGYPGWRWTVSVVQLEGDEPTVLEAELLPGEGALVAPDWVPWSTRLEEWQAQQAVEGEETDDEGSDEDSDDASFEDSDEDDDDADSDEDDDADDDDESDEDDDSDDLGDDVYDGLDPEAAIGADDTTDEDADSDDDDYDEDDDEPEEPASDSR